MNYQKIIDDIYAEVKLKENRGEVARYIPELSKVSGDRFGVCLRSASGEEYGVGDWQTKFSIQSISKVLSLAFVYRILDGKTWERVGVEPSGNPFNSLVQLEADQGIPRNPLINAGAIVICDMLLSHTKDAEEEFLQFVRTISSNSTLNYSEAIVASEKSVGYRNVALCNFIKSLGNIDNDPEDVLDFYFKMCSIEMTCQELVQCFTFLYDSNFRTADDERILTNSQIKRISAIMLTCGFYDESGEFSFRVGLPGKSGVGGGIVALYPNSYAIAVWSPKLNVKGNSERGMKFLELFTSKTELSIF